MAGHPSLLPCSPPRFSDAWGPPPIPGLHDVGLAFLAEPVRDIKPARLARVGSLDDPRARRAPMLIVGHGLLQSMPSEQRWLPGRAYDACARNGSCRSSMTRGRRGRCR
jgi:hypothetical protein